MRVNDWYCLPFFIATMMIGNLVLLKLFLALLLSAFGGVSEKKREEEEDADANKLQEAIDRIKRLVTWVRIKVQKKKKQVYKQMRTRKALAYYAAPVVADSASEHDGPVTCENLYALPTMSSVQFNVSVSDSNHYLLQNCTTQNSVDCNGNHRTGLHGNGNGNGLPRLLADSESTCSEENDVGLCIDPNHEPIAAEVDVVYCSTPDDCLPKCFALKLRPLEEKVKSNILFRLWWALRVSAYKVVVHKYFETFIILMIVCSSASLALEDKYLPTKPVLQDILRYLDTVFNIIFFSEMILKWLAFGFTRYFTDAWCWVDFVCVAVSHTFFIYLLSSSPVQTY